MVQSTGAANAQYLQDIVLGGDGINNFKGEEHAEQNEHQTFLTSSQMTAAAQIGLDIIPNTSQTDTLVLETKGGKL